jgi:glycosyltransferase involved in cell wall biosynthesis
MRVQIVDPSAFTPPYDHSLAAALARAGAEVELVTSRFLYGPTPAANGYRVSEAFYRRTAARGLQARGRQALKLAEHVPDMLRLRSLTASADVVHYQWLTLPSLDAALLPPARPRLYTLHYPLPTGRSALARERALMRRMDAVIAHTRFGATRLRDEVGLDPERVHLIHHGAFDYLTRLPEERPLPEGLARTEAPVVLFFGLLRPYKGIDVLLEAFRGISGAALWIVGMPRMSLEPLRRLAAGAGEVRFVPRFITDPEIPAYFRRADLVVLPYREIEQSGVLYTALAFAKPLVLSAVGGFAELAEEHGAVRLVPPGDPEALRSALAELLSSPRERERLAAAAGKAAAGPYSWQAIADRTLSLYRELLAA